MAFPLHSLLKETQEWIAVARHAGSEPLLRFGRPSAECFAAIARKMLGIAVEGDVCASIHRATGGNPFYVLELVRGLKRADHPMGERVIDESVLRYRVCACKLRARLMRSDLAPGVQAKRGSSPSNLTNCR